MVEEIRSGCQCDIEVFPLESNFFGETLKASDELGGSVLISKVCELSQLREAFGQPLLPQPLVLEVSASTDHAQCPGRGLVPWPLLHELLPLSLRLQDKVSDRVRLVDAHAVVVHLLLPCRQEDWPVPLCRGLGFPLQVKSQPVDAI